MTVAPRHVAMGNAAWRVPALVWLALSLTCCVYGARGEPLEERLAKIARASGGAPSGAPRLLRYEVAGHDGPWIDEIVTSRDSYATRRTRDDGKRYAFGLDARGSWLTVADQPSVVVAGDWALEARAAAALHQLSFSRVEEISRDRREWELAVLPDGGQRLTLFVDRRELVANEIDTLDAWARISTCDQLEWRRSFDGAVLSKARCGTGNDTDDPSAHHIFRVTRRLVTVEPVATIPEWAAPRERRERVRSKRASVVRIEDERRIAVPVHMGDHETSLVLDTGAWHTVIGPETAEALGVIPTGEPPFYMKPPWLADSSVWVGVVATTRVGKLVMHGQRVLVAENPRTFTPDAGLLGCDFFREVVLDVDTPARALRLWERDAFNPPPDAKRMTLTGSIPIVQGEVVDVARGSLALDTGMPDEAVIHHPMMKWRHRRHRGDDAFLGAGDSLSSPDYHATIGGLSLGPFAFPQMPAVGRDRDGDAIGGGVGIVGMGVMRYLRMSFDLRGRVLHATPGDGYRVLRSAGVDVSDGVFGPTIDRVISRMPAQMAGLKAGDVVVAVDGAPVMAARDALRAIAKRRGAFVRVAVKRGPWLRAFTIDLMASPS